MPTQRRNDQLIGNLEADFQLRYEPNFGWKSAVSSFLALPGLRGFWPMSSVGVAGQAIDLQGLGNHLTLNGNPVINHENLISFFEYDGTGDFHSITDAASGNAFDILGTETYIDSSVRGLTVGGWFWFDALGSQESLIVKGAGAAATSAFFLDKLATNEIRFLISDGAAFQGAASAVVAATTWYFIVGRYIPSTSIDVIVNNVYVTDVVGVPAAAQNVAADLNIASFNSGVVFLLDGRASLCFMCASALNTAQISALFHQTRAMFGV
jgi:hypothetical protein